MMLFDVMLLYLFLKCIYSHFTSIMSNKRLTVEQRAEIATLCVRNGVSIGALVSQFSLSKSTVHNIVKKDDCMVL